MRLFPFINFYQPVLISFIDQILPLEGPEWGYCSFLLYHFRLNFYFAFMLHTSSQVLRSRICISCFPIIVLLCISFSFPATLLTQNLSFSSTVDWKPTFFSTFNFNPPTLFSLSFPTGWSFPNAEQFHWVSQLFAHSRVYMYWGYFEDVWFYLRFHFVLCLLWGIRFIFWVRGWAR